jgi:hypothetical protein
MNSSTVRTAIDSESHWLMSYVAAGQRSCMGLAVRSAWKNIENEWFTGLVSDEDFITLASIAGCDRLASKMVAACY